MNNKLQIPLIFAVTGHRDLCSKDIKTIKEKIATLFNEYKTNYPHTPIILLSALAEGADMLAAEVAMEMGISLHQILPYEEEAYLESFKDEESKKLFYTLKAYASKCETLEYPTDINVNQQYQKLGEYLSDTSNILLALWDGTDTNKEGGTSEVIRYFRSKCEENHFDRFDGNALYIIKTPRETNPAIENAFSLEREYIGLTQGKSFEKMLQKVDTLNMDILQQKIDEKETLFHTIMSYFEKKAQTNQTKHSRYMVIILFLTWFAIVFLELMHNLHDNKYILGYGLGLLGAFSVYHFFMKSDKIQNDFIFSRGFTEALRVQNIWNNADIKQSVANHYLINHHHKFSWITTVLKNINYITKDSSVSSDNTTQWIDSQIDYFKETIKTREAQYHKLEYIAHIFYWLGVISVVSIFIFYGLETLHFIPHGHFPYNWHFFVLSSGLFLLTSAFIGEKYVQLQGYKEKIYNFGIMLTHFENAKNALSSTEIGSENYKKIIRDLGKKALDENSKWVILGDDRKVEASFE